MKKLVFALPALLLFACPAEKKEEPKPAEKPVTPPPPPEKPPEPPPAPVNTGGTGMIKGTITFEGTPPKPEVVDMKKDKTCMELNKAHAIPEVMVDGGKLAEVLVRISSGLPDQKWPVRSDAITLDQQACVYHPKMIAIQVGQELDITNSDPLLHNVHAIVKRSEFNQAMPTQGMKAERKFKAQDLEGKIACEVHPWMHAALRVLDNPFFAVTGPDGSFTIENVPPGKYQLEIEHGKLGKKTKDVEVKAGDTVEVSAEFP